MIYIVCIPLELAFPTHLVSAAVRLAPGKTVGCSSTLWVSLFSEDVALLLEPVGAWTRTLLILQNFLILTPFNFECTRSLVSVYATTLNQKGVTFITTNISMLNKLPRSRCYGIHLNLYVFISVILTSFPLFNLMASLICILLF